MKNKDVMEKLKEYYLTQKHEVIAQVLAGLMIDISRICFYKDMPKYEQESLRKRCFLHNQELAKFIKNGPDGDIKINITNSELENGV